MSDEIALRDRAALVVPRQGARNAAVIYLATLSAGGQATMAGALSKVARRAGFDTLEAMPWERLRYEHVQALRAELADEYAAAYVNKILSAIRGAMHVAWQLGQIDAETYQRIKDIKSVTGSRLLTGRAISAGELGALLGACHRDATPAGVRDAALIATAYAGGLRRAELAGLRREGLREEEEQITVRLVGKRNKERLVYLDGGAAVLLRRWLAVRGEGEGPLFWRARKGGRVQRGSGLSPQAVGYIVRRRAIEAGVEHVTPHDFRRSFISDLLDAGVDISTVAGLVGHENVQTTGRYDRRGERAKRSAVKRLFVPVV